MKIRLFKKSQKDLLDNFISELIKKRETSDNLVICPEPTGYAWLGVKVATISLFGTETLCIPQYYSESIFTDKQINFIIKKIQALNFRQLFLSGYPPYFTNFVNELYKYLRIKVIYHGFFSELSDNPKQIASFTEIINLSLQKKIQTIGFVKAGMAKTVAKLYEIDCVDLVLPTNIQGMPRSKPTDVIQVGCLVSNNFRKNLHNQLNAALLIDNAIVHVFENNDLAYLPQERIIQHKLMDHDSFMQLLGSMHINLHVTYSESWGQVLSESIALGIPCLSAYTSSYFDYHQGLKEQLIVDGFDDSWNIANKIRNVLSNYGLISLECLKHARHINDLAEIKTKLFLDD